MQQNYPAIIQISSQIGNEKDNFVFLSSSPFLYIRILVTVRGAFGKAFHVHSTTMPASKIVHEILFGGFHLDSVQKPGKISSAVNLRRHLLDHTCILPNALAFLHVWKIEIVKNCNI